MQKLLVFAGPNGSGKSTIIARSELTGDYINADEIQAYFQCTDLEAAQNAEQAREYLLEQKADFTMETVLSTPRNLSLIRRAKEAGYEIRCMYVLTTDPKINVRRVRARVERGGHDVPEDKVRARYVRALGQLPSLFDLCGEVDVFDNSPERGEGEPSLIVRWRQGTMELYPNSLWTQPMLEALVDGTYPTRFLGM